MRQQDVIADIETRARAVGVTIKDLCALAKVHQTTFSRWKASADNPKPTSASMDKLEELYAALETLEAAKA